MNQLSTATTVIPDFFADAPFGNDVLLRIQSETQRDVITITSTQTQTVRDNLNEHVKQHLQDVELLRSVIFWQKRTIDYQALHTAFLLNSFSEEEFEQESEKFVVHQKYLHPKEIATVVERLDSLTGLKFDTSDYSDYFQCSQENVMAGLQLLPCQHFAAMLPSSTE